MVWKLYLDKDGEKRGSWRDVTPERVEPGQVGALVDPAMRGRALWPPLIGVFG